MRLLRAAWCGNNQQQHTHTLHHTLAAHGLKRQQCLPNPPTQPNHTSRPPPHAHTRAGDNERLKHTYFSYNQLEGVSSPVSAGANGGGGRPGTATKARPASVMGRPAGSALKRPAGK